MGRKEIAWWGFVLTLVMLVGFLIFDIPLNNGENVWAGTFWFGVVAVAFIALGTIEWEGVPGFLQYQAERAQPYVERGADATGEWVHSHPAAALALLLSAVSAGSLLYFAHHPKETMWAYVAYFSLLGAILAALYAWKGAQLYEENAWTALCLLSIALAVPAACAEEWVLTGLLLAAAAGCGITAGNKWDEVGEGLGAAGEEIAKGIGWLFSGKRLIYTLSAIAVATVIGIVMSERLGKTLFWTDYVRVTQGGFAFWALVIGLPLFCVACYWLFKPVAEFFRK